MFKTPDPIDIHVGSRVRLRRTLLGMSQTVLGNSLDLTFQQIQKYERGANRIGSSRLYKLSKILDIPVSFFFEGLEKKTANRKNSRSTQGPYDTEDDKMTRRQTLELVRAYYRIADPKVRKNIFEMIKSLAKS